MTSPLAVLGLVGRLVVLFSLLMLVPLAFTVGRQDAAEQAFLIAIGVTAGCGLLASLATRRYRRELNVRDGFLLVGLTWATLPAFAALPLWLALPDFNPVRAYFEAASAFSTTGATVLSGLDDLPLSINVWRCFLQLVGGMGIIVLAVAILPLLGVGGMQLFRAETAGPMKDAKLTPRIAETARGLWAVYFVFCTACFFAYRWAGMSWEDAFIHMCSTMGLGGLSSHDASFGYWNSPWIEAVAMVFMALSGLSFAFYFMAWRQRSLRAIVGNPEARAYAGAVTLTIAVISTYLWWHGTYPDYAQSLRHTAFNVISIATTAGYASQDYLLWPAFAPLAMLLLGCFATCAGSTGGGIKMVRMLLLTMRAQRELVRIVHPNVVNPIVLGGRAVETRVMQNVVAFMMVYGATLVGLTMALLFTGVDPVTAFTAVIACVNNIGPGMGQVGPAANYGWMSEFQLSLLAFGMLVGRLELLSAFVLMTPQFWRR